MRRWGVATLVCAVVLMSGSFVAPGPLADAAAGPLLDYEHVSTMGEAGLPWFISTKAPTADKVAVELSREGPKARIEMAQYGLIWYATIPSTWTDPGRLHFTLQASKGSVAQSLGPFEVAFQIPAAPKIAFVQNPNGFPSGRPLGLRATVAGARAVNLLYRSDREMVWSSTEMRYEPQTRNYFGLIPGLPVGSVQYRVIAEGRANPQVSAESPTYSTLLTEVPSPTAVTETAATTLTQYFYDLYYYGYWVDNVNVSNVNNILNPQSPGSWVVNSKVNQPRGEGSNPHKGLDLGVTGTVYSVSSGRIIDANSTDSGYGYTVGYTKVGLDLNGDGNYTDTFLYYIGLDEKSSNWLKSGHVSPGTPLGDIDARYGHVHISWRNGYNWDLNQQRFWSNRPELDYGNHTDFITDPFPSGRSVYIKVYAINTGGVIEASQSPYFVWRRVNPDGTRGSWSAELMTMDSQDRRSFWYTFSGGGFTVEYYIYSTRWSLSDANQKAYRPAEYAMYFDGVQWVAPAPDVYFQVYVP